MASSEHLKLASYVKAVHQGLRDDSELLGSQEAWKQHCANEVKLKQYAMAMQHLATKYWDENCNKTFSKAVSRVKWTCDACKDYFFGSEISKHRRKDQDVADKLNITLPQHVPVNNVLRLLDVGSCYNPFKNYEHFDVVAIDIAPANPSVLKCDFLWLQVGDKDVINKTEIVQLQVCSFDVIVFSLFLEYLPSPEQRRLCCNKAYELLKTEGLLIVVTPDSKHVGANAKLMKSWRHLMARMGFSRIKYEKLPHLHCMAFRKSFRQEITQRWSDLHPHDEVYHELNIPQDFQQQQSASKQQTDCSVDLEFCDDLQDFGSNYFVEFG